MTVKEFILSLTINDTGISNKSAFADRVGIARSHVYKMFRMNHMSTKMLAQICKAMDIDAQINIDRDGAVDVCRYYKHRGLGSMPQKKLHVTKNMKPIYSIKEEVRWVDPVSKSRKKY